jgi:type IV pilus assembly protein PilA
MMGVVRQGPFKQRWFNRGFTLVELLIVVSMIGILAAIAMVGYRKYLMSARTGDAKAIISAIRVAEESHRAETLTYLNCSGTLGGTYYPMGTPNTKKYHWKQDTHGDYGKWMQLNVATDSPTYFGFLVISGAAGVALPATSAAIAWPMPTEPWYLVQAQSDMDADTVKGLFLASSMNGEIYVEREGE